MSYLIILDDVKNALGTFNISADGSPVYLLSFTPKAQTEAELIDRLQRDGIEVKHLNSSGRLDNLSLEVREKFSKLIADIPNRFMIGEKNLKQAFTFEN